MAPDTINQTPLDQQIANVITALLNGYAAYGMYEQRETLLDILERYGADDPRTPQILGAALDYLRTITGQEVAPWIH